MTPDFSFDRITHMGGTLNKDALTSSVLHDGELLEVIWPNGDRDLIKVKVEDGKAYHKSYWKKIPIMVPIVGMRARRVLQ